jgi:hypothetical protein
MSKRIFLASPHMSDEGYEKEYVKEAFDTNWVVPLGPNVNGFEEDLKNFVGEGKEVVALSAGTAAATSPGTRGCGSADPAAPWPSFHARRRCRCWNSSGTPADREMQKY